VFFISLFLYTIQITAGDLTIAQSGMRNKGLAAPRAPLFSSFHNGWPFHEKKRSIKKNQKKTVFYPKQH